MSSSGPSPRPAAPLKELLGGTTAVVGTAYGLAYSAHLGFWGAFGLSPGQVGISGTELLGRLTVGAAWILLVGGLFALAGPAVYWLAERWKPTARAALPIAIATPLVVGYLLLWTLSGVELSLAGFAAILVGVAWIGGSAAVGKLKVNVDHHTVGGPIRRPVVAAGVQRGALALGIAGLLAVLTNLWMFGIGEKLANGSRSPATFVIGATPPYATVIWSDPAKVPASYVHHGMTILMPCGAPQPASAQCQYLRPLLFLGTADGASVVWDCKAHATYFVAGADARVELSRDRFRGLDAERLSAALGCSRDAEGPALVPSPASTPSPRVSAT
ncbi:hypothetical protein [Dactylosporangium sp. NPDC051541]|uniref:hypothetical protein n=1 Tax=Dactylosporangium sp. NPDC051541 TaxID=3363977 RepID=UPI0037BC7F20